MLTTFKLRTVVRDGGRAWIRNFVPFVAISALLHLPIPVIGLVLDATADPSASMPGDAALSFRDWAYLLTASWGMLLLGALAPVVTYRGVVAALQHERVSFHTCLQHAARGFVPALGTLLLVGLFMFGAAFCAALALLPVGTKAAMVAAGLVMLVAWTVLYVVVPAAVGERGGVLDALRRSRALTHRHRIALGFLGVLFVVANAIVLLVTRLAVLSFGGMIFTDFLRLTIVGSLNGAIVCAAYCHLRVEKDGVELARVFD